MLMKMTKARTFNKIKIENSQPGAAMMTTMIGAASVKNAGRLFLCRR